MYLFNLTVNIMQRFTYACATNSVFLRKQYCSVCRVHIRKKPVHGLVHVFHSIYILYNRCVRLFSERRTLLFRCKRPERCVGGGAGGGKRRFVRKRIQLPKTTMGSPDNAIGPNKQETNHTSTPPKNLVYL